MRKALTPQHFPSPEGDDDEEGSDEGDEEGSDEDDEDDDERGEGGGGDDDDYGNVRRAPAAGDSSRNPSSAQSEAVGNICGVWFCLHLSPAAPPLRPAVGPQQAEGHPLRRAPAALARRPRDGPQGGRGPRRGSGRGRARAALRRDQGGAARAAGGARAEARQQEPPRRGQQQGAAPEAPRGCARCDGRRQMTHHRPLALRESGGSTTPPPPAVPKKVARDPRFESLSGAACAAPHRPVLRTSRAEPTPAPLRQPLPRPPAPGSLDNEGFRRRYAFLYDEVLPGDKERLQKALKARGMLLFPCFLPFFSLRLRRPARAPGGGAWRRWRVGKPPPERALEPARFSARLSSRRRRRSPRTGSA